MGGVVVKVKVNNSTLHMCEEVVLSVMVVIVSDHQRSVCTVCFLKSWTPEL